MAPTKDAQPLREPAPEAVHALLATQAVTRRRRLQSGVSEVAKSLALLLLASVVAVAFFRGRPIHYIPDSGPGHSVPGIVPEAMAIDFAVRWVKARYTFTPSTFKGQVAEVVRWVHPSVRLRFQKEAEEEEREVRKAELSSQVYLPDPFVTATIRRRDATTLTVVLVGVRSVWVGTQKKWDETMQAEVTVVPWDSAGQHGHLIVLRAHVTPVFNARS